MSCHTYVYNDSSLGLFLKKIPSHVHTSHSLVRDMAHDWYLDMPSRVHIQGVDGSREWMRQVTQMKSHITHMKKSFHTHGNTSGRQRRGWLIRALHDSFDGYFLFFCRTGSFAEPSTSMIIFVTWHIYVWKRDGIFLSFGSSALMFSWCHSYG